MKTLVSCVFKNVSINCTFAHKRARAFLSFSLSFPLNVTDNFGGLSFQEFSPRNSTIINVILSTHFLVLHKEEGGRTERARAENNTHMKRTTRATTTTKRDVLPNKKTKTLSEMPAHLMMWSSNRTAFMAVGPGNVVKHNKRCREPASSMHRTAIQNLPHQYFEVKIQGFKCLDEHENAYVCANC